MKLPSTLLFTPQNNVRPLVIYWVLTLTPFILLLSIFHNEISAHFHRTVSGIQSHVCAPTSHEIIFYDYDEFQSLSPSTDAAWDNLLTPNGGMLYEVDEEGRKVRGRGISMFHQLHCLQMVRARLQQLDVGSGNKSEEGGEHEGMQGSRHAHAHKHHDLDGEHILHCLDYVRQGILCGADSTLEPQKISRSGDKIADYKRPHKCGDAKRLYAASVEWDHRMPGREA